MKCEVLHIEPLKMDLTEGSETSSKLNMTPGKHPKEHIEDSEHGENLKSRMFTYSSERSVGASWCVSIALCYGRPCIDTHISRYTHTHKHPYPDARTHTRAHTHTHARTHTNTVSTRTHTHTRAHTHTHAQRAQHANHRTTEAASGLGEFKCIICSKKFLSVFRKEESIRNWKFFYLACG
jgi:hypothetical protein